MYRCDFSVFVGQVVAWDPKEKKLLSFQTLSTRKRKDEKAEDVKVMVILQVRGKKPEIDAHRDIGS